MNKTVLVTGGTRGIGKGIVSEFLKNNYNVAINYSSNDEAAEKLKAELLEYGSGICFVKCDISDSVGVGEMIDTVHNKLGYIDILVNNAGIAPKQMLITDISDEEIRRCVDVNILGTLNCTRAVLPDMVHNKWGRIINISSVFGIAGGSCEVVYSMTKSALIGLTKALSQEVAPSGITVNCVAPGFIDTDMNSHLSEADMESIREETPLLRLGKAEDIAGIVCFLAGDKAEFITGQIISASGGWIV